MCLKTEITANEICSGKSAEQKEIPPVTTNEELKANKQPIPS